MYGNQRNPLQSITNSQSKPASRLSMSLKPAQRLSIAPSGGNIPQSARKPSVSGSRLSMAPSNRQSTIGVKSGARPSNVFGRGKTGKTDPRPLSDKSFQAQCIKKLIEYVTSHGYNQTISPKILSSPSAKDFANLLQFLYRKIDPTFVIEKLEEDVPNIFRSLAYPFQISKSALASVGTPHTWPSLLGALTWLVELLLYSELLEKGVRPRSFDHDDTGDMRDRMEESKSVASRLLSAETRTKAIFEYTAQAYDEYMRGRDDFTELESALTDDFDVQQAVLHQEVERLNHIKQQTLSEIGKLTNGPDNIVLLEQELEPRRRDKNKFLLYIEQLVIRQKETEAALKERQKTLEALDNELLQVNKERDQYQQLMIEQSANAADLERLLNEKNSLEELHTSVATQKESLEKAIFEKETDLTRKTEEIEKHIQAFNAIGRKMKIIPATAKHAQGVNLQIAFSSSAPEQTIEHLKNIVKPTLDEKKDSFSKATVTYRGEGIIVKDQVDQREDAIAEKREQIEAIESSIQHIEQVYNKKKAQMQEYMKQKRAEIDAMREEAGRVQANCSEQLAHSKNELARMAEEQKILEADYETQKNEANEYLLKALEVLKEHKEYINENLAVLLEVHKNVKQNMKKERLQGI